MARVILFDVNETLLDLGPLQPLFLRVFGDPDAMRRWFALLLHSTLVATLTDAYSDFGALARAALEVVAAGSGAALSEDDRDEILSTVQQLPPHPEVAESLARLRSAGLRLATLTNSSPQMVSAQMENSGLGEFFERNLSVHEVRRFKPAPEAYHMAAEQLGVDLDGIRLVAAHDWDVFGALRAGCRGAYIARGGSSYHPLYEKPDVMGSDLREVADQILHRDL